MITKTTGPHKRLREEIDRTRSVHDARKMYKNRVDNNVSQSHHEMTNRPLSCPKIVLSI